MSNYYTIRQTNNTLGEEGILWIKDIETGNSWLQSIAPSN